MSVQTKTFSAGAIGSIPGENVHLPAIAVPHGCRTYFSWFQIIVAYVFFERALWSSRLALQNRWALISILTVVLFVLMDRPSVRRLGLSWPTRMGAGVALVGSILSMVALVFLVHWSGGEIPVNPTWPSLHSAWQYVVWALVQSLFSSRSSSPDTKNCSAVLQQFG